MSTITATVTTTITTIPLLRHRDTVINFPADQDDFVAKYEATNDHLSVSTVPQINAVGDQIDIITGQINIVAGEVNTNASIATTKAGEALASANAAALSETAAAASAASAAAVAGAFVGTSTTSVLIALGSKSFTTQLNEQYTAGIFMTAVSQANPANYMFGQVTSYNSGTGALVLDVQVVGGSGTYTDWNLSLVGARGAQGPAGATFTGGSLTSALNESRATVASHATTSDIWGALGNQIDFTGTATVTAFPNAPQGGAERTLICAGACSFTAGANMVIDGVPSGTVTCASGDTVIVRAISTTQFKLTRLKVDGTAQVSSAGGSMIFLSEIVASGAATVDIETGFSSTYDDYIIIASAVTGSSNAAIISGVCKQGGAYVTSGCSYGTWGTLATLNTFNGVGAALGTGVVALYHITGNISGNVTYGDMEIRLLGVNSGIKKNVSFMSMITDTTTNIQHRNGFGTTNLTSIITGFRVYPSEGTLSGTFRLYGIKKS